ncbi:hypothetical protein BN2475_160028 [Paraburkholderia ribeironis]|uniref:Uncharacterized protein n=1 Tax=Paraburkholderia ribeironis TaxID=1247936 RepID=A0A1N7RU57_9BURK|nr:hypothetical protein [Paraburkholderia ribeironis]SIT38648.1 hypothetical protein BN2475_160028 [Paraburkholderia ribeironis]
MTLVSQAEYARRLSVTRAAVGQWKKAGRIVTEGSQVNVEASDARLKRYRRAGLPEINEATKTVKRGRPSVKQAGQLNSEPVCLTCVEITERLEAIDWTQTFDWSAEAQDERVRLAARCIGWEAVRSTVTDDGHWGGFQLRILASIEAYGLTADGIPAGHGFELDGWQVLRECRDELEPIDDGDEMTVRLELLPLLARPFGEWDKPR